MIVLCKTNREKQSDGHISELPIFVGAYYVVYCLRVIDGRAVIHIWDKDGFHDPLAYNIEMFEIVDSRISKYWILDYDFEKNEMIFSFKEWVQQKDFFYNIVESRQEERKIFQEYRRKMDLEFRSPDVSQSVEKLKDFWIMCPKCDEAWEDNTGNEMVKCPKCEIILLKT